VPTVERPLAQSVEDRFDVDYLAPLAGLGRRAIDAMVAESLVVETGPSASVPKADYEVELRALLADEYGSDAVERVFPDHTQSRVHGRR
jgi:predicted subunit of tRNA(5-methylaminomethyl-2-thiouridylate) methyltransferase